MRRRHKEETARDTRGRSKPAAQETGLKGLMALLMRLKEVVTGIQTVRKRAYPPRVRKRGAESGRQGGGPTSTKPHVYECERNGKESSG